MDAIVAGCYAAALVWFGAGGLPPARDGSGAAAVAARAAAAAGGPRQPLTEGTLQGSPSLSALVC